ncbi:MAG: accessory factor UbiK family protein [Burkholderiaceae bacterium]|jgi:BMFP domain-containing protein YqiC
MDLNSIFEEMQARIADMARQTPAREFEQNLRALLQQGFSKLDLATREQLDLQAELLSRTRAKLTELEARIADLEGRTPPKTD